MQAAPLLILRASIGFAMLSASNALPSAVTAETTGQIGWADAADPVGKQLVEQERIWATLSCSPSDTIDAATDKFVRNFIADDFVGTSPKGSLYGKSDMLPETPPLKVAPERDCKLLGAKVHFVRPDLAVIYGKESASIAGADGRYSTRTLVWTDTLLRRDEKWQIVAVQDMVVPTQ